MAFRTQLQREGSAEQKIHAAKQDTKTRHTDWNSGTEDTSTSLFPASSIGATLLTLTHGCQLTRDVPWMSANKGRPVHLTALGPAGKSMAGH
eukprot:1155219-Pelagomonas_calceolata.AAC.2